MEGSCKVEFEVKAQAFPTRRVKTQRGREEKKPMRQREGDKVVDSALNENESNAWRFPPPFEQTSLLFQMCIRGPGVDKGVPTLL